MRRCPTCGTPVGDEDKHCNRCGRSLTDVLTGPGSGAEEQPAPPPATPGVPQAPPPAVPPPGAGAPQPGYAPQPGPGGYAPMPGGVPGVPMGVPNHPSAMTAMLLGIFSLVCCGIFLGIPAIIVGSKAKREIDASGGMMGGRGQALAGIILGWIAVGWSVLWLLIWILGIATGNATVTTTTSSF